ncbi:MAG: hypothetical protein RQ745_04375 [Longimicrobiales bacterium]|nr:hypothetical protein [Longimicrobiales bacterium]
MHRWIATVVVVSSLLAGCGPAPPQMSGAAVCDSAGIRIVEAPGVEDLPVVQAPSDPRIRVGGDEAGPAFERIMGGALLPDGGAAVVDVQAARLHLIAPTGTVEAVGRRGEGPGEFQLPMAVEVLSEGRLVVWDDGTSRLSTFSADGTFLESRRVSNNGPIGHTPRGLLGDSALGWVPTGFGLRPGEADSGWITGSLIVSDLETLAADTVVHVRFVRLELDGNRPSRNPFTRFGSGDLSDAGFIWATNDRPEVQWIGRDGAVVQIARSDQQPIDVTDEVWARYETTTLERNGIDSKPPPDTPLGRRLQEAREAASATLPYFRYIHAAPEGGVWLSEYTMADALASRFLVISSEGFPLHWMEFGTPIRVLDVAGDRVLGVEEDEWGVQSVVVYSITR